jgi:hypothetical protein
MYKYTPYPPLNHILSHFTPHCKMSSTHSSSPTLSTNEPEQPQLARRRSGSPEQNWMARAAQHAAMII